MRLQPSRHLAVTADPRVATLILVLASVCFGLVPGFARELQAQGLPDAAIAFYRYAFTAFVALPFLPRSRAKRGQALLLIGSGALMGLGWTGYLQLVGSNSIAAAGVIYMSYPAFAVLFAWALLGVRPGLRAWAACAAVLAAAALMMGGESGPLDPLSLLWALPAPCFFGLMIVAISAMVPRLTTMERLGCTVLGAVVGLLPAVAATDPAALLPADESVWLSLLGLGLMTATVPQLLYILTAPTVGPARASAAGAVELPTMIVVGWLGFSEAFGLREGAAAILVLSAIAVSPSVNTATARGQRGVSRLS
jgi:drug/metabolite transporter (DMT)-like permease